MGEGSEEEGVGAPRRALVDLEEGWSVGGGGRRAWSCRSRRDDGASALGRGNGQL